MKLLLVTLFALIAFVSSASIDDDGPSKITDNNVGNIVNVDVEAQIHLNNQVNVLLMSMLARFIDQQGVLAVAPSDEPQALSSNIPPDVQSSVVSEISKMDPMALQYLSKYLNH